MDQIPFTVAGTPVLADRSGALMLPDSGTLVVSDLHLEKGSAAAQRGRLVPPYDTDATLDRLERTLEHLAPRAVVSLGDSFHDPAALARMSAPNRDRLSAMVATLDWTWITGNHDAEAGGAIGGTVSADLVIGGLTLRHAPRPGAVGEIAGHLHPAATVATRGRRVRGFCFACDGNRLIAPPFGAYTGGLSVRDPAIRRLMGKRVVIALIGRDRLYRLPERAVIAETANRVAAS